MSCFTEVDSLQGKVVGTSNILCTITLEINEDKLCLLYVALCGASKELILPVVGDHIVILKLYKDVQVHDPVYYLYSASELYSRNPARNAGNISKTILVQLIREFKLSLEDLRSFNESYTSIDLKGICAESPEELKVNFLRHLLVDEGVMDSRKTLIVPTVTLPATCSYLDLNRDYGQSPYYAPGVHYSRKHEYLIGYLHVNKDSMFVLTDGRRNLIIKISALNNHEVLKVVNKVVVVKKTICITEIYRGDFKFQYLFCLLEDVEVMDLKVINHMNKVCDLFDDNETASECNELYKICVINVCQPNSTARQTVECWVHVLMYDNDKWVNRYLCLEKDHLLIVPFLDIGNFYEIRAKEKLIHYNDPEIRRAAKTGSTHKLLSGRFVKVQSCRDVCKEETRTFSVEEICRIFKENRSITKKYVNVDAVISLKVFANPDLHSRTKREIKSTLFGSPGEKTHVIQFESQDKNSKFSIYLNNWERKQVPLGLIPNMRVIVRHVELGKNSLRATGLTSFLILGYHEKTNFSTTNLSVLGEPISYADLGDGHNMPVNVLVRAKVTLVYVQTLKIQFPSDEPELTVCFTVADARGKAYVICKSIDFLKKLMFNKPNSGKLYENWSKGMKRAGLFTIKRMDNPSFKNPDMQEFYTSFQTYLHLCLKSVLYIEMLCRRMEPKNVDDNNGMPLWFATEIIEIACSQYNGVRIKNKLETELIEICKLYNEIINELE